MKFLVIVVGFSLAWLPQFSQAAGGSIQTMVPNLIEFFNTVIIPFLFGIGFLFFLYNTVRYFIIGAANKEDHEKARAFAIYSVIALVFLVIFAGVVNMFAESIGLEATEQPTSDYVDLMGSTGTTTGS